MSILQRYESKAFNFGNFCWNTWPSFQMSHSRLFTKESILCFFCHFYWCHGNWKHFKKCTALAVTEETYEVSWKTVERLTHTLHLVLTSWLNHGGWMEQTCIKHGTNKYIENPTEREKKTQMKDNINVDQKG